MMNRQQAKKLCLELKARGLTYPQIAHELGKTDYVSPKTGKKLHSYDVYYMLNSRQYARLNRLRRQKLKLQKQTIAPPPRPVGFPPKSGHSFTSELGTLEVVRAVAFNNSMDEGDRLALIQLVLEPKSALHRKKVIMQFEANS